jgi:O-antigen ligase
MALLINKHTSNSINPSVNENVLLSSHFLLVLIQALFVFIAPLICMGSNWYEFANLPQGLYIQSISGFMLFIWLLDCYINKKFEIKKSKLYLPLLLILIWSSLSFLWATNIYESWIVLSQWIACGLIFFVIYNMLQTALDVSIIIAAIMLSLSYLIIIGVIQRIDPSFDLYQQVIGPSATFANKNMFSDYLVIVLPLCFYFFIHGFEKKRKFLQIFSGLVFVAGTLLILFSKTRSGIVAIPVVFLLLCFFLFLLKKTSNAVKNLFSKQRLILLIGFVGLSIILTVLFMSKFKKENESFSFSDFGKRIKSIVKIPEEDQKAFSRDIKDLDLRSVSDSTSIRLITWRNTLSMIADRLWVGYGLNNWQIHYGEYRNAYYNDPSYKVGLVCADVHNDYLQILADLGVIGFLLFAWFIISLFVIFKKIFFSSEEEIETKLKALSLILCLVGFGMACLFSFVIARSIPSLLLFIYAALLANIYFYSKAKNSENAKVYFANSKISGWVLIPVLALSIYVTYYEKKRGDADQLFKTAKDSIDSKNYDVTVDSCEKLFQISSLQHNAHLLLAGGYMLQKKYDEATIHLEKGVGYYPNDLLALYQAGTVYLLRLKALLETENFDKNEVKRLEDKSLGHFEKALKIRGDFDKALNNLGFIYESQANRLKKEGDVKGYEAAIKKAENCFERAANHDSCYVDPYLNLIRLLVLTERSAEAIPVAMRVIVNATQNLEYFDKNLKKIISENETNNPTKFYEAMGYRTVAFQDYLSAASVAISFLRMESSKTSNLKGLFEALELEKKYLGIELEGKTISRNISQVQYEKEKNNSNNINNKNELMRLENIANTERVIYENAQNAYPVKMARLLILSSDIHKLSGSQENCIKTLQQVIEMSQTKSFPEQESIARLKLNEAYMSNTSKEYLVNKIQLIEENFNKATYKENLDLINYKNALELKFVEIKKTVESNSR